LWNDCEIRAFDVEDWYRAAEPNVEDNLSRIETMVKAAFMIDKLEEAKVWQEKLTKGLADERNHLLFSKKQLEQLERTAHRKLERTHAS